MQKQIIPSIVGPESHIFVREIARTSLSLDLLLAKINESLKKSDNEVMTELLYN